MIMLEKMHNIFYIMPLMVHKNNLPLVGHMKQCNEAKKAEKKKKRLIFTGITKFGRHI